MEEDAIDAAGSDGELRLEPQPPVEEEAIDDVGVNDGESSLEPQQPMEDDNSGGSDGESTVGPPVPTNYVRGLPSDDDDSFYENSIHIGPWKVH
jgi:hypothetical protein